ncbi:hypothetical protein KI387_015854, partial [Taxus chinensis]
IRATPAHSGDGDEPIDVDKYSEEFTGGENEEEMMGDGIGGEASGVAQEDDSDSEWHDIKDILRAEREEVSVEKEAFFLKGFPSQDSKGDDESVAG